MRRLVVFVVGVLLAAAVVPAAASAQSGDPLNEVALLSLDGCFDPDQFVVSGGYVATGGCFGGPGMQLAREFLTEDQQPVWTFNEVVGVSYGDGIGGIRTTFAGVEGGLLEPLAVFSATQLAEIETFALPGDAAFVYDPGTIAGGRSPSGRDRLVVPVATIDANFAVGANFVAYTRQAVGPMGETGWDVDVVAAPLDGSVPEPVEFTYEARPTVVLGDKIVAAYETYTDEPAVVIGDVGTGTVTAVANALPALEVSPFPTQIAADTASARVFIGWGSQGPGSLVNHVTMVDVESGASVAVSGLPDRVTALTVVRRDEFVSNLFVATDSGALYVVTVDAQGVASPQLLLTDTGAAADELTVTALSGSGDLLGVMERTTSFTVAPQARVRVLELGDLGSGDNPLDVGTVAPDIPSESYLVGEFTEVRNGPVRPPGADPLSPAFPAEDCLVDVTGSAPYPAVCFSPVGSIDGSSSLRESYIAALVATDRPPDEVLWFGQGDETPVKP